MAQGGGHGLQEFGDGAKKCRIEVSYMDLKKRKLSTEAK